MNRRDFLKKLSLGGLGTLVSTKLAFAQLQSEAQSHPKVPMLPWGYQKLDPIEAFKRGYLGYFVAECSAGAFWAITSLLRETIGYPYTLLPLPTYEEMIEARKKHHHLPIPMKYGNGGIEGYGTVCGALNGAACAIEWAMGPKLGKKIIRRLFRWYEETAFPTPLANEYAQKGLFPVKGKYDKPLPSVRCDSVLCHVVVSKWCAISGFASGSKQRSERCARITAAVAKKAVDLMNAALEGTLEKAFPFKLSHETASCRECHYKGKNYEKGQFARGFIACESCHVQDINAHVKAAPLKTAFGYDVGSWLKGAVIGTGVALGAHLVVSNLRHKEDKNENDKS